MCIRDRREGISFSVEDKLAICRLLDEYGVGFIEGGWPGACLLYTSDAADERSSVDLGGRRIIKKKKQIAHVEMQALIYSPTHNTDICRTKCERLTPGASARGEL